MSDLRQAAQQALEALEALDAPPSGVVDHYELDRRKQALRDALAQQEREDIAQNLQSRLDAALLLEGRRQEIAQPHREWRGLSDTEVLSIHQSLCNTVGSDYRTVARAVEAKLKEKNA